MNGDAFSKLVAKAVFLATLTTIIVLAGNTEASLAFKHVRDNIMERVHAHR